MGPAASPAAPLLEVADLAIAVARPDGRLLQIVDSATFGMAEESAVGLAGESGSGKTMLCRAILGTLARRQAVITGGQLRFDGQGLVGAPESVWRTIRGRQVGYVPQSALAGLNPVLTIATHFREVLAVDGARDRGTVQRRAVELLDNVRIARPKLVLESRPFQLSGGMRQRVMLALALARRPRLLVADEPTTALDVTVQREIIRLLRSLREEHRLTLLLVTHDLAVLDEICDELVVMYAGATIESGPLRSVVDSPRHPYTRALVRSRIDLAASGEEIPAIAGDPAMPGAWAPGCRFAPRCEMAEDRCLGGGQPALLPISGARRSACLLADRLVVP